MSNRITPKLVEFAFNQWHKNIQFRNPRRLYYLSKSPDGYRVEEIYLDQDTNEPTSARATPFGQQRHNASTMYAILAFANDSLDRTN